MKSPSPDVLAKLMAKYAYHPDSGNFVVKATMSPQQRARIGEAVKTTNNWGYTVLNVAKKMVQAHRAAWYFHYGDWPIGPMDHINRIRTDNRIENLRISSASQNNRNRSVFSKSLSGVHGVTWNLPTKSWRVHISVNGRGKMLGYRKDLFEAACLRRSAELHYGYGAAP